MTKYILNLANLHIIFQWTIVSMYCRPSFSREKREIDFSAKEIYFMLHGNQDDYTAGRSHMRSKPCLKT